MYEDSFKSTLPNNADSLISNQTQFSRSEIWTSTDTLFLLVSEATSFLSVCGCLTITSLYFSLKDIRTTSRLLLVFLSVADLLVAFTNQMSVNSYAVSYRLPDQESTVCQINALMWIISQGMAALWTSAVVTYLFLCVVFRWVTIANRIVFLFHIFCWGMPVIIGLTAYWQGVLGYNTIDILIHKHPTSCWLSDNVGNLLPWYAITVEGWVLATFVLICLLYVPISFTIARGRKDDKDTTDEDVIEELAKQTANEQLRFIPAIYVCTRIWGTMHFLFTRYPHETSLRASDWLLIFRAFGDNCQGFVNAIFFCLATKQIRRLLASKCICCIGCFQKTKTLGKKTWMRVPIVKMQRRRPSRPRALDGSDLDVSGISLDLPSPDETRIEEDEVIFER